MKISRFGSNSGIYAGIAFLMGMVFVVLPFTSAPASALQPFDTRARLEFIGSLSQSLRSFLGMGAALYVLAALFMLPLSLALAESIKESNWDRARIATGMLSASIPFLIIAQFEFFLLLRLSTLYVTAGEEEQIALGAVHALVEGITLLSEPVFWLFTSVAVILFGPPMRSAGFSKWLVFVGYLVAGFAFLAVILGALQPALGAIGIISRPLLITWLVWSGLALRKIEMKETGHD